MLSLKDRLLLAEEGFLSALAEGHNALSAFEERWQTLINDIDDAMESSTLDTELSMLVHTTSLRISILADTSAELADNYNAFTSQLMDKITTLMGDLAVTDDRLCLPPSHNSPLSPAIRLSPTSGPSIISGHPPLFSRKRRRDVPESASGNAGPSKKRCRSMCSGSDVEECTDGIPSAVPSPPISSLPFDTSMPPESSSTRRYSRKRRLSDTDADIFANSRLPKRVHVGPRLHAVSDSFVTYPVPKFEPEATSSSLLLDSSIGWDICPLSTTGSDTVAHGVSGDQLFDSFSEPLGPHSPSEIYDLDTFLQGLLAPLPPLVTDDANTPPQCGSPVSGLSANEDVGSPLDSSSSSFSMSCPSTPPPAAAIEVFPPSYHLPSAGDDDNLTIYGDNVPLAKLAVGCAITWSEWLDPLDPFVWLSAPPPPYSLRSSYL